MHDDLRVPVVHGSAHAEPLTHFHWVAGRSSLPVRKDVDEVPHLGRTGWPVSEIAFVDTAELYGAGHSEEVIGRALRQWSGDRIYVATKIQPVVWPSPDDDHPKMRGRYPGWYLRDCVEAALRRLQTERIDLLQLHGWMPSGITELDWLETLNELRVEGKVDHIGVSIRDYRPEEGVDLATLGLVDSLQVVFNLFRTLCRCSPILTRGR